MKIINYLNDRGFFNYDPTALWREDAALAYQGGVLVTPQASSPHVNQYAPPKIEDCTVLTFTLLVFLRLCAEETASL